jgi:hypothetical protein
MRRNWLVAGFALPLWISLAAEAQAFFPWHGECHHRWSISCPRVVFRLECGPPCCPGHPGCDPCSWHHLIALAMPWYATYPVCPPGYHPGAYDYGSGHHVQVPVYWYPR